MAVTVDGRADSSGGWRQRAEAVVDSGQMKWQQRRNSYNVLLIYYFTLMNLFGF